MSRVAAAPQRWSRRRLRRAAAAILAEGLQAADPARLVRRNLVLRGGKLEAGGTVHRLGRGRLVLVAAGKAAATMARAAEDVLGDHLSAGLAVDTSPAVGLTRVGLRVAGHPVPDERGLAAASELETLVRGLGRDDLLLSLIHI